MFEGTELIMSSTLVAIWRRMHQHNAGCDIKRLTELLHREGDACLHGYSTNALTVSPARTMTEEASTALYLLSCLAYSTLESNCILRRRARDVPMILEESLTKQNSAGTDASCDNGSKARRNKSIEPKNATSSSNHAAPPQGQGSKHSDASAVSRRLPVETDSPHEASNATSFLLCLPAFDDDDVSTLGDASVGEYEEIFSESEGCYVEFVEFEIEEDDQVFSGLDSPAVHCCYEVISVDETIEDEDQFEEIDDCSSCASSAFVEHNHIIR